MANTPSSSTEQLIGGHGQHDSTPSSTLFHLRLLRQFVIIMLVGYISWMSPYTIGFIDKMKIGLIIVDYFVSVLFGVDAFVPQTLVRRASVIETVLGVVPAAVFFQLFPTVLIVAKVWCFVRLFLVKRLFDTIAEVDMNLHRRVGNLLKWIRLIYISLLSIHFTGCMFYTIAILEGEGSWLDLIKDGRTAAKNPCVFEYVASVYWAATAFSTVGYGDIHPITTIEMAVSVVSMLCNLGLVNYVLNSMVQLLAQDEALEASTEFAEMRRVIPASVVNEVDANDHHALCIAIEKVDESRKELLAWKSIIRSLAEKGVALSTEKVLLYYTKGVLESDLDLLDLIYNLGGDINVADVEGRTPLHTAVSTKNLKVADWLLRRYANVNIRDKSELTPLAMADHDNGGEMRGLFGRYIQ